MDDSDWQLPLALVVGLIVSVAVHVAAVPGAHYALHFGGDDDGSAEAEREADAAESEPKNPLDPRPQTKLGQRESDRQTVAWISHEAYRQMVAPKAKTHQPALQQQAKPTQGPPELDPTPPVPEPSHQPTARRPAGKPPVIDSLGAARPTPGLPQTPTESGEITFRPDRVDEPGPATQPTQQHATRQGGQRGDRLSRAKNVRLPSRPTSSPKSDKESPTPTQLTVPQQQIRPGAVIAADGIEIKTKALRPSAIARLTIPRNPKVSVTFDKHGEVTNAQIVRSTGFDNVDSPILAALYQWKATGPRVEARTEPFSVDITIRLIGE